MLGFHLPETVSFSRTLIEKKNCHAKGFCLQNWCVFYKNPISEERTAKVLITYKNIHKFNLLQCMEFMYSAIDFHAASKHQSNPLGSELSIFVFGDPLDHLAVPKNKGFGFTVF